MNCSLFASVSAVCTRSFFSAAALLSIPSMVYTAETILSSSLRMSLPAYAALFIVCKTCTDIFCMPCGFMYIAGCPESILLYMSWAFFLPYSSTLMM